MAQPDPTKAALRTAVLARRDTLSGEARAALGARITERLLAQPDLVGAHTVLAYLSFGTEFDTAAVVSELLGRGSSLVLPRVNRDERRLELHYVTDLAADLAPGVWGIRELRADRCPRASLDDIDFVLAPGVAFTRDGERLGYGGGFYDRLFAQWLGRPIVVAAAFEVQMVDSLPVGPSDIGVDLVVTEDHVFSRTI